EVARVQKGEVLRRELGHAVRGNGAGEGGLAGWKRLRVSIHRRAAGEDQALQPAALEVLEQALGGQDVVTRVAVELVAPARAHTGLAGKVVDDVGAFERGLEVGD